MSIERKRKPKGQARNVIVSVRFDDATKARVDAVGDAFRRSTANYVEWAVTRALAIDEQVLQAREAETLALLLEKHGYKIDHDQKTVTKPTNQPA